jgi:condensation domain-containing protein
VDPDALTPACHNVHHALRSRWKPGELGIRQAIAKLVARHEILRTEITGLPCEPAQSLFDLLPRRLKMQTIDLSRIKGRRGDALVSECLQMLAVRGFKLESPPLFRFACLWEGSGKQTVSATFHHIIVDSWSLGVLINEIAYLYDAFARGIPHCLAVPTIQYRQLASRAAERGRSSLPGAREFWKSMFLRSCPGIRWPSDPGARSEGAGLGKVTAFRFPGLGAGLERLCREGRVSVLAQLLSTFADLIAVYTGGTDFIVDIPVASRDDSDTESSLGCFMDLLPIRIMLDGKMEAVASARKLHGLILESEANKSLPYSSIHKMAKKLGTDPAAFRQVLCHFNLPSTSTEGLAAILGDPVFIGTGGCEYQILAEMEIVGADLAGHFILDRGVFGPGSAPILLEGFKLLLDAAVARSDEDTARLTVKRSIDGFRSRRIVDAVSQVSSRRSGMVANRVIIKGGAGHG